MARVEGDRDVLAALIETFGRQAHRLLEEIRSSVSSQDSARLERIAHKLRGTAGMFGAQRIMDSAKVLEEAGKGQYWSTAESVCSRVETQIANLRKELAEWTETHST